MLYICMNLLLAAQILSAKNISTNNHVPLLTDSNEGYRDLPMVSIAEALEGISGCKYSTDFFMERIAGLPPDKENYYDASVETGTHRCAVLKIEFVTSVVITADPEIVRVDHLENNTYLMKVQNPLKTKRFSFRVLAPTGKTFPNVKLLELNGRPLCKLKPWYPKISGRIGQAASSPFRPPSTQIPKCGRKKVTHTALITKGELTKEGDWPWHVALYLVDESFLSWSYICGATIVTSRTVLTAAHCVVENGISIEPYRFKIVVGKYNLDSSLDEHAVEMVIKRVIIHDNFVFKTMSNDIAILKVMERIRFNNYVQPICLWDPNQLTKDVLFGEFGTVVGWGTNEKAELSRQLTVGSMRVVPDTACLISLPSFFPKYLNNKTFCAGNGPNNGTSACNGDSGGGFLFPIELNDEINTWYLRGVVSLSVRKSNDLCDPNHYIVMTDIAAYLPWIEQNLTKKKRKRKRKWENKEKEILKRIDEF